MVYKRHVGQNEVLRSPGNVEGGGGELASGLVETDSQRLFVGVDTFSLISGEQQRNAR